MSDALVIETKHQKNIFGRRPGTLRDKRGIPIEADVRLGNGQFRLRRRDYRVDIAI